MILTLYLQVEGLEARQVDRERIAKTLMDLARTLHEQHKASPGEAFRSFAMTLPATLGTLEVAIELAHEAGPGSAEPTTEG